MSANTSTLSARQLEILRRLAEREAVRRQAAAQAAAEASTASATVGDAVSSTAPAQSAGFMDAAQLEALLREERLKNDVAWAKVREQEDLLSSRPARAEEGDERSAYSNEGETAAIRAKELELAKLELDIARLTQNLPNLDPPQSDAVLALLTRATLASAIEQYEGGVRSLREEMAEQRSGLQQDEELLRDLAEVRIGMQRRRDVIRKRGECSDFASIERKLLSRQEKIKAETRYFLGSLIATTDKLFKNDQDVERAQLRHLIDRLINKAWDSPNDAFVDAGDDYMPAVPAFLLRANVAVEHARDSNRLRLIEFQRSAVG